MNTLKKLQFYMGKRKVLMPIALTLSGLSGLLSLMPFIFIWLIVRSLLLTGSVASGIPINVYAWWAVGTAVAGLVIYFAGRFKYADELSRMGACIKVEGNSAIIDGVNKLTGARVSAPDLRAGAALVIAGLAAEGITIVDDIVYIQRGYENFEEKLRSLGAEIERVSSEKDIQKFRLRVG